MEVLLKNTTQILQSPKVLTVSNLEFETNTPTTISLQDIEQRNVYERITVNVKISKKFAPELVATGKKKQDVIVCDATGTGRVTLWEENVDKLKENSSYTLENFMVREYNTTKYLGMSLQGSQVILIDDIGEVKQLDDVDSTQIQECMIIRVSHLETHKICFRCNARVEPSSSSTLGRCTKLECAMLQRYDVCHDQLSAKMLFMDKSKKIYSLMAYGEVVRDLAGAGDDTEITEECLMKLPQLSSLMYNDKRVITSFSK